MTELYRPSAGEHPITPPPELVKKWLNEGHHQDYCSASEHAIAQAAQWGADMELKACCEVLTDKCFVGQATLVREWRRPKPPSLKEQALRDLDALAKDLERNGMGFGTAMIRRALEALDD